MESILDKFEYWLDRNPEKTLFSFLDISGNVKEKYSYIEFYNRINLIASNLLLVSKIEKYEKQITKTIKDNEKKIQKAMKKLEMAKKQKYSYDLGNLRR